MAIQRVNNEPILFQERPPLSGKVKWSSFTNATIEHNGLKIALENLNLYVHGKPMYRENIPKELHNVEISFEAVPHFLPYGEDGCSFYATLAFVGEKPTLRTVASTVQGPPPRALGRYLNHTFVGKVLRLYLPSYALVRIRIGRKPTVVGLSVKELTKELDSTMISNYLKLKGTYLKFKIKFCKGTQLFYYAYDVVRSSEKDYKAFCDKTELWQL